MRSCRHCAHENADHLAFCSQCGRKLRPHRRRDCRSSAGARRGIAGGLFADRCWRRRAPHRRRAGTQSPARGRCSTGRCRPIRPGPRRGAGAGGHRSRVRWLGESIGYIYVYLRSKLDAGERRRRLLEERAGAEALLAGALNELGQIVLRDGIQHAELTGLLEAIGRAHARREAAAADAATSESLQQNEATRLGEPAVGRRGRVGRRRQGQPRVRADPARRDRRPPHGGHAPGARQGRAGADRARHRDESGPVGDARLAQLAHDAAGLAAEQRALEENAERLDAQLADLRDKAGDAARRRRGGEGEAGSGRRRAPAGGVGDGGQHRGPACAIAPTPSARSPT